ncbi:Eukaryotic translation initiation factor 5 [Hibiscus syriacus]|uniref:Eukaryotic translation initiation factor 5 n=1 Tax=Hibiscus syriacus TaxID=106335 RepID=A0A6A2Y625_HIBSY|nr:Eukaryotic translation initiation factor 5 [Hibiscus syriacus]
MALQNIGASNSDDAFYRYKMPKMITKIEGRGNGIKTNLVNMVEIAEALARPASYTTKYFGCELGAQSKFDEKTGTSHVNGAHDTAKLAGLLENFIKKFVQCYGCGNPETEIIITKTQMITLKCAACGFISDVDMRDRHSFLKKSSKDKKAMRRAEKERLKEGEAADEELKKIKKRLKRRVPLYYYYYFKGCCSQSQADENEAASDDDDDDDDVQWQTDTSLEAAKQRIQEQLSAVSADMVMLSTNEEKKRTVKKSPEHDVKAPEKVVSTHEKLVGEIKEHLKKGSSPSQLKSFLGSLSGASQEITDALLTALFDDAGKGFAKEVTKKKNYLAAVAVATKEEGWQMMLLHSIESFCGKATPMRQRRWL